MRNKVMKAATSLGSVALILAGSAYAGGPTSFDKWSAAGGTITMGDYDTGTAGNQTCPTGFTCNTPVTGDGFMQRQMTRTADSKQFFQTVVTDSGVTGAPGALTFSDETFIMSGTSGLAGKQRALTTEATVSDYGASTTAFSLNSNVLSGWAQGAGEDKLQVTQDLTETLNATSEKLLVNTFSLDVASTGNLAMAVDQAVLVTKGANTAANSDDDIQRFVMKEYTGTKQTQARSAATATPDLLWSGGDTDWVAGNDIKVVWVGQQLVASGGESFSFQSYENVTSSSLIGEFRTGQTLPYSWVAPFGTAPTLVMP